MSRDDVGGSGSGDQGFGADDGGGWHEPEHLGQGASGSPSPAEPRGGDVPAGAPEAEGAPEAAPTGRGRRLPGELDRVFGYQGDQVGAQGWALQHGWMT